MEYTEAVHSGKPRLKTENSCLEHSLENTVSTDMLSQSGPMLIPDDVFQATSAR